MSFTLNWLRLNNLTDETKTAQRYFEESYSIMGFDAQRRYPNEEFCRFMGRNFFKVPHEERKEIKILEVGSGAGANLWMVAREGFHAIGVDISESATELSIQMLESYGVSGAFKVGSMTALDFADNSIDAVADIFSSHCLDTIDGEAFLKEVRRVLKPNGLFFSYFPSKNSDTWTKENHPDPSFDNYVDDSTLNGLHRETGPFAGNSHPFRFLDVEQYKELLHRSGLKCRYCETLTRTYRTGSEVFEFIIVEAQK